MDNSLVRSQRRGRAHGVRDARDRPRVRRHPPRRAPRRRSGPPAPRRLLHATGAEDSAAAARADTARGAGTAGLGARQSEGRRAPPPRDGRDRNPLARRVGSVPVLVDPRAHARGARMDGRDPRDRDGRFRSHQGDRARLLLVGQPLAGARRSRTRIVRGERPPLPAGRRSRQRGPRAVLARPRLSRRDPARSGRRRGVGTSRAGDRRGHRADRRVHG